MKPVAFDYARPATLAEALALLAATPEAVVLAGGQTLGPLLNLRLAQPALLVDITRIAELAAVGDEDAAVVIGATVTHAAIEDRRVQDPANGFLARVASGIAYRAVRTRGTIGGSLANADPAADWLACLTALDAELEIAAHGGARRRMALAQFVHGAMHSDLAQGELIVAVRIPRFSRAARFGFHKICRKTGEFADAIGVVVHDPQRARYRLVASTGTGAPQVIDCRERPDPAQLGRQLGGDAIEVALRAAALKRALIAAEAW
jgi:carbon-monoxide dehydrogenase medium subunit